MKNVFNIDNSVHCAFASRDYPLLHCGGYVTGNSCLLSECMNFSFSFLSDSRGRNGFKKDCLVRFIYEGLLQSSWTGGSASLICRGRR
jgi:hypothetical protein